MIYVDSSALLKLVHDEGESAALADWLTERTGTPVVSSVLAKIEVLRASRRINPATVADATALVAGVDLIPLNAPVVDAAAEVGGLTLRSLDAIHLASALSIRSELSAFVAYDRRLADAATSVGLDVVAPSG